LPGVAEKVVNNERRQAKPQSGSPETFSPIAEKGKKRKKKKIVKLYLP